MNRFGFKFDYKIILVFIPFMTILGLSRHHKTAVDAPRKVFMFRAYKTTSYSGPIQISRFSLPTQQPHQDVPKKPRSDIKQKAVCNISKYHSLGFHDEVNSNLFDRTRFESQSHGIIFDHLTAYINIEPNLVYRRIKKLKSQCSESYQGQFLQQLPTQSMYMIDMKVRIFNIKCLVTA